MAPCGHKMLMISPQSQKLDYIFDVLLKVGLLRYTLHRVNVILLVHNFMSWKNS